MTQRNYIGEKKGPIYYISINRPEKRNALMFEMLREIADMVEVASPREAAEIRW